MSTYINCYLEARNRNPLEESPNLSPLERKVYNEWLLVGDTGLEGGSLTWSVMGNSKDPRRVPFLARGFPEDLSDPLADLLLLVGADEGFNPSWLNRDEVATVAEAIVERGYSNSSIGLLLQAMNALEAIGLETRIVFYFW